PPRVTLFPYTTLFRSSLMITRRRCAEQAESAPQWTPASLLLAARAREVVDAQHHGVRRAGGLTAPAQHLRNEHCRFRVPGDVLRSEEHTSELQSRENL